jgi:hypothetical protein
LVPARRVRARSGRLVRSAVDERRDRVIEGQWTEKPALTFTHWRGLSADPTLSGETENIDAEATAAEGVRAVWNAFFPSIADDPKQGEAHRKDA